MSKESANFGNLKGMVHYSNLCLKTKKNKTGEIKCDYKEAFKFIKIASKNGDAEAMSIYGNFLLSGIGCLKKDLFKAVKYFKRSYEKGNLNGYARYGFSLIEGEGGLQKNVKEGLRLIKHSFDNNDPIGVTLYAYCLYLGLPNLEKNLKLSFEYNMNASSMGYYSAISNTGACYHYGDGTDVDIKEAIKYYMRAIEEGSFTTARNLGLLLIKGYDEYEIKADYKEGMKYLKFASENGDTDAMHYYSVNVANNKSTVKEIELMEYYLKKGVYLKVDDLILIYAQLLYKGNVLPQDKVKAARYFKMCADLGNIYGMRMYGNCLYDGIGVEKNLDETLTYFKMAADYGSVQAMVIYASLLSKGEQGSFDQDEVIKYYKMAIEKEEKNESNNVDLTEAKKYIEMLNQKENENVI